MYDIQFNPERFWSDSLIQLGHTKKIPNPTRSTMVRYIRYPWNYLEDIAVTGTQYPERLLCRETAAGGGSAGANTQIFLQLIRRQILRPTRTPH